MVDNNFLFAPLMVDVGWLYASHFKVNPCVTRINFWALTIITPIFAIPNRNEHPFRWNI